MQETSPLLKLSLQGKWIALARAWLEENIPVAVDKYYCAVAPLMPKHIQTKDDRRFSGETLCRNALQRLKAKIVNNVIVSIEGKACSTHNWPELLKHAVNGKIDASHTSVAMKGLNTLQRGAFREWLRRHGAKSIERGVYDIQPLLRKNPWLKKTIA